MIHRAEIGLAFGFKRTHTATAANSGEIPNRAASSRTKLVALDTRCTQKLSYECAPALKEQYLLGVHKK